jgi:hypothetical protein
VVERGSLHDTSMHVGHFCAVFTVYVISLQYNLVAWKQDAYANTFSILSLRTAVTSMLHTYWTSVCKLFSAEKQSSLQVLAPSNDEGHADGNVERRRIDASEEAVCDDSNVFCLNATCS